MNLYSVKEKIRRLLPPYLFAMSLRPVRTLAWKSPGQQEHVTIQYPCMERRLPHQPAGWFTMTAEFLLPLLLAEGLAVSTLVLSRRSLMGAHQNTLQRAEVCILAVMLALLNSTFNRLVCMAIHRVLPPFLKMELEYHQICKTYISFTLMIDFFSENQYNICGMCEFSQICIIKGG